MVLEQGENENQINKAKNIVEYKFKSIEDNFNLSNNHVCGNKNCLMRNNVWVINPLLSYVIQMLKNWFG